MITLRMKGLRRFDFEPAFRSKLQGMTGSLRRVSVPPSNTCRRCFVDLASRLHAQTTSTSSLCRRTSSIILSNAGRRAFVPYPVIRVGRNNLRTEQMRHSVPQPARNDRHRRTARSGNHCDRQRNRGIGAKFDRGARPGGHETGRTSGKANRSSVIGYQSGASCDRSAIGAQECR
jgi:hypothetical protein